MSQMRAAAYLTPAHNVAIETTPGTRRDFHHGKAHIYDDRECVLLLARPDITLEVEHRYLDRLPGWIDAAEQRPKGAQAKIALEGQVFLPPSYEGLVDAVAHILLPVPEVEDEPAPVAVKGKR